MEKNQNTITNLIVNNIQQEQTICDKINKSVIIVMDSCRDLGMATASILKDKVDLINHKFVKFGNNEINICPDNSVRGKKVFIMGSGSNNNHTINDNIIAICGIIRACRDASAKFITVILAYYPYCRSDKKDQGRAPIMAKLMGDFFKISGANRLITADLHSAQIQGFFDGPFDNIYAIDAFIEQIKKDYCNKNYIIISPDAGGEKRAKAWASKLQVPCTFLTKSRDHNEISVINNHELVHQVNFQDKLVIIVDDIGDTLGTLCSAAEIIKTKGAMEIIAVVTHGLFSNNAIAKLENSVINKLYTTNTICHDNNMKQSIKIQIVDLSIIFSQVINCCACGGSISDLFDK